MNKRSLTNVGGAIERWGDPTLAEAAAHALDVAPAGEDEDEPERAHVHGFHAYPARLHPTTAARLVDAITEPRQRVLDPFCGSGTVCVEARMADRVAIGSDLNPLAVRLALAKVADYGSADLEALLVAARAVAAVANDRRQKKAGPTRRFVDEDVRLFAPHVVLELDSIRAALAGSPRLQAPDMAPKSREVLFLVLSSLLVKLSQQRSDTARDVQPKRLASGYPTRLFVKKTEELVRRIEARVLPDGAPRARIEEADATDLAFVHPNSVDAVVTSPPYAATYDYHSHHALRLRWLGLSAETFAKGEIGARRSYVRKTIDDARQTWNADLVRLFGALARVCRKDALVALVIGDSAIDGHPLRADDAVADAASDRGMFEPVARASQERPHFHGPTGAAFRDRPRAEHVLLLRRT